MKVESFFDRIDLGKMYQCFWELKSQFFLGSADSE